MQHETGLCSHPTRRNAAQQLLRRARHSWCDVRETGCGIARRTLGPFYAYRHTTDSTRHDESALQSRLEPRLGPGADVAGVRPSPGAVVAGVRPSPGAIVTGVRPSPGADVAATDRDGYVATARDKHECTAIHKKGTLCDVCDVHGHAAAAQEYELVLITPCDSEYPPGMTRLTAQQRHELHGDEVVEPLLMLVRLCATHTYRPPAS